MNLNSSIDEIREVLNIDPGNLHALCNLAIFYQHFGKQEELEGLIDKLPERIRSIRSMYSN